MIGDYFAMGGHGFYIWACYAVTFTGLVLLGGLSFRAWKAKEHERADLQALSGSRRARGKRKTAAPSTDQQVS